MFTKIRTKDGEIINFVTQQYEVGTYLIINNDASKQGGISDKEEVFHKKLRINVIKQSDVIVSGSILECKSKYPINEFENEKV